MVALTFTAAKQTTFTTPIEGSNPDYPTLGLEISRAAQSANDSTVLTVRTLTVNGNLASGSVYGAKINAPDVSTGNTVQNVYGLLITAPTGGTRTNSYTLRLNAPAGSSGENYSLLSDGPVKIDSSINTGSLTFNLINATATTVNFAGAATALTIGASSGTTTVNNDLKLASGKVFQIVDGVTTKTVLSKDTLGDSVVTSSLTTVGTITTGTWSANSIAVNKGGTGLSSWVAAGSLLYGNGNNNALSVLAPGTEGQFLTLNGSGVPAWSAVPASAISGVLAVANGGTGTSTGSITASTGALTFTAASGNNNVNLVPTGTGTVDVGGFRITSVGSPTQSTDAATKGYVDAVKQALDIKDSVRVATTAALTATASGTGSGKTLTNSGTQAAIVIDGITLVANDRVLVKDQGSGSEFNNGIYTVTTVGSVSTNWVLTRATDADNSPSGEVTPGMFTFVEEGTTNQDTGWVLSTNGTITIDTTALTFVQFSAAGQVNAGAGLTKTGLTLDVVGTANRITVNPDSIDIASTYAGQSSITTLGTIGTGTWQGSVIAGVYGGTGVANDGKTITLGGNISTSNTFSTTGTSGLTLANGNGAARTVNFPNAGSEITIADLLSAQTISNKTYDAIVYQEFASQTNPSYTVTSTNARLYNKNGSLYFKNVTNEYAMLSTANAPYYNLGANTTGTDAGSYRRNGNYLLWVETSNANLTRLTSDGQSAGASNVIKLPSANGSAWFLKIYVVAWNNTDSNTAAWEISSIFRKASSTGGTIEMIGDPVVIAASGTGQSALEVSIDADTGSGGGIQDSVNISVKGIASKTIRWVANIQTTEVG